MSYISSLVDRTIQPGLTIRPRLRGWFEQDTALPDPIAGSETSAPDLSESLDRPGRVPLAAESTLVPSSFFKEVPDEPAQEIRQSPGANKRTQEAAKEKVQPVKKPRFEPSPNLIEPRGTIEQTPVESPAVASRSIYPNPIISVPSESSYSEKKTNEDNQQKQASPLASITPEKITLTKESHQMPQPSKASLQNASPESQPKATFKLPAASYRNLKTEADSNASIINISIGRVEVRVSQTPAQLPSKPKKEGVPIMSLDEYLQKRNQQGS